MSLLIGNDYNNFHFYIIVGSAINIPGVKLSPRIPGAGNVVKVAVTVP